MLREQKPTSVFLSVLFPTFSHPLSLPTEDWNWAIDGHSGMTPHYFLAFTFYPAGFIISNTAILQGEHYYYHLYFAEEKAEIERS